MGPVLRNFLCGSQSCSLLILVAPPYEFQGWLGILFLRFHWVLQSDAHFAMLPSGLLKSNSYRYQRLIMFQLLGRHAWNSRNSNHIWKSPAPAEPIRKKIDFAIEVTQGQTRSAGILTNRLLQTSICILWGDRKLSSIHRLWLPLRIRSVTSISVVGRFLHEESHRQFEGDSPSPPREGKLLICVVSCIVGWIVDTIAYSNDYILLVIAKSGRNW